MVAEPERIVLTNGAEGALTSVLLALARPGDAVLTEALCYSGLRNLASRVGLHLEPVAIDEDGIVPEALSRGAAAWRQVADHEPQPAQPDRRPDALGPARGHRHGGTGAGPAARRGRRLRSAGPRAPAGLASLAPERTLYLTSISKFLAPGLRLGIAHGPNSLVRPLIAAQRELSLGHAPFSGELFARTQRSGLLEMRWTSSARRCSSASSWRRTAQRDSSSKPSRSRCTCGCTCPHAGPAPRRRWRLARTGVLVTPADRFFIGRGSASQALRVSLAAAPTRTHLRGALERFASVLAPDASPSETGSLV